MLKNNKKNIGIIFASSKNGGVFQLALSIADSLVNYCGDFRYSIIHYASENPASFLNLKNRSADFIAVPDASFTTLRKVGHFLGLIFNIDFLKIKYFQDIFRKNGIDILIYPTPSTFDFFPGKTPFVASIPNLMHRYYPDFPEFGFWENVKRNIVYKWYAENSVLNTVDARQGVEDLYKFLKIKREKTKIAPYIPPPYIFLYKNMKTKEADSILEKYAIPRQFLFYPAQFWYHKNHTSLIKALALAKEKYNVKINLALTGGKKGHYDNVFSLIKELGLESQIFHLGYVSEKEIVALYKKSLALVFPSLFGPTDIPCLEAMVLGTPIACSNLFEIPKQVQGAGIYFDPFDEKDMAEKIYRIWQDEKLRRKLIENGRLIAQNITQKNYARSWRKIIKETINIIENKK